MRDLDEAVREALLNRDGPPSGAEARVLAQLRPHWPSPDPLGEGASPPGGRGEAPGGPGPAPAPTSALWVAKVAAAILALTTSGLVGIKVSVAGVRALRSEPSSVGDEREREPQPQPQQVTAEPRDEALDQPKTHPSEAEVLDLNPATSRDPGVAARAKTDGVGRAAASESTGVEPHPSLAQELALIGEAKRQRASDPARALAALERHEMRFPKGTLAPERDALQLDISCALGRTGEAVEFDLSGCGTESRVGGDTAD